MIDRIRFLHRNIEHPRHLEKVTFGMKSIIYEPSSLFSRTCSSKFVA